MKFREIKRRLRVESAYLNPILLGICVGIAVLFGALFTTNLSIHPIGIGLPRTALPSFVHILFQLVAYAILGAAFSALATSPLCGKYTSKLRLHRTLGLALLICILILCYVWIPVVCRARSFFLGALLCGVILLALFVLFFLTCRISILSAGLIVLFTIWMLYILYITISFLFFA